MINNTKLTLTKAVELLEYKKSPEDYWNKLKTHKQVVNKAVPIGEVLYPSYLLFFFFIMQLVILYLHKMHYV